MCTIEGNTCTIAATGTSPCTASSRCLPLCYNDFIGTKAGNRHYSTGTTEGPLLYGGSLFLHQIRSPYTAVSMVSGMRAFIRCTHGVPLRKFSKNCSRWFLSNPNPVCAVCLCSCSELLHRPSTEHPAIERWSNRVIRYIICASRY